MAFIEGNADRPFAWGEWDCILFATACAAEITGEDRAAAFRGKYSNRKGARAILRELGKGTLLRTIDYHFERKAVPFAQRGDLIWYSGSVGVCLGRAAAFITDPKAIDTMGGARLGNFVMLPRSDWQKAWGV